MYHVPGLGAARVLLWRLNKFIMQHGLQAIGIHAYHVMYCKNNCTSVQKRNKREKAHLVSQSVSCV